MIKIPLELMKEILYFINDWIRIMGFGREHARLARLVWNLFKQGVFNNIELAKFYYVRGVVENFQRIERIENEKS
jgi:hypothetical protein